MYLRLYFEFFKSPVFLGKFCIGPVFFMLAWFLMVSISLFKFTFADSIVYSSMKVLKIWCDFCFTIWHWLERGSIRFIHTITVYCLYFPFRAYLFIVHIDNWFNISLAVITYIDSVRVWNIFLVRSFSCIWTACGNLAWIWSKSLYSLTMWRNANTFQADDVRTLPCYLNTIVF